MNTFNNITERMRDCLFIRGFLFTMVCLFLYSTPAITQESNLNVEKLKKELDKGIPRNMLIKVDSILLASDLSQSDELKIKAFKVDVLIESFLYDQALQLSNEVLESEIKLSDAVKVEQWLQQALLYEIVEDFQSSNTSLNKVEDFYSKHSKDENYGKYLIRKSSLSRVLNTNNSDSLAIFYARRAEQYGDSLNFGNVRATGKMLLAFLSSREDKVTPLKYLYEALEVYEQENLPRGMANVHLNLGSTFLRFKDYNKALYHINKGQYLAKKQDFKSQLELSSLFKAIIFEEKGTLDSALYYQKQIKAYSDMQAFENQQIKVSQLNYQFEIDKRLTAKKETEERLKVEQANVIKLFWLLSLLVIITAFTLYLFRNVKFKNREITAQRDTIIEKNEVLRSTIETKEFYLKELNHRVKNNLSLIMSLVSFQKDENSNSEVKEKFEDLEQRIRTIALAHEQFLYDEVRSEGKEVFLKEYLNKIQQGLQSISRSNVSYEMNTNTLSVPIEIGLPLGIMLNELMTNSIKHTPALENLHIKVQVERKDQKLHFSYSDSGDGFKEKDIERGLGLFIIESMVNQLEGKLDYSSNRYQIIIPLEDHE